MMLNSLNRYPHCQTLDLFEFCTRPWNRSCFFSSGLKLLYPHKRFPRSSITGWSVAYVWLDSPCSAPCGSCSSPTPRTPGAPPPPGKQQSKQSARRQTKTNLCLFRGPHVGIAEAPGRRLTGNHSNKHHSPERQTQHTLHTVSLQIGLKGPKRTKQVKSDGGPLFRQLLLIMSLCIIKTNYRLFGRLSELERMIFAGKNYFWGKKY